MAQNITQCHNMAEIRKNGMAWIAMHGTAQISPA